MYAAGLTAIGQVRSHNEDVIFHTTQVIGPLPNLFIVADGMGGHNAGEVASAKSLEYSTGFIRNSTKVPSPTPEEIQNTLVAATLHANSKVFKHAVDNPAYYGMGTTFSACSVVGNILAVSHIGDSRIYTISHDRITQITTDHTFVEEMVQAGSLTPGEAKTHPRRNVLTRVLGCDPEITADGSLHDLTSINSVLLCSDGLTDMLSDDEIMKLVNLNASAEARAEALINAANNHGGIDNISAIIIDVKGDAH